MTRPQGELTRIGKLSPHWIPILVMIHLPLKLPSAASGKAQLFLWPFNWASHGEHCLPTVSFECAFPVDLVMSGGVQIKRSQFDYTKLGGGKKQSRAESRRRTRHHGTDKLVHTFSCHFYRLSSLSTCEIKPRFLLSIWNFSFLGDRLLVRWHVPDKSGATVGELEPFLSPTSTNV